MTDSDPGATPIQLREPDEALAARAEQVGERKQADSAPPAPVELTQRTADAPGQRNGRPAANGAGIPLGGRTANGRAQGTAQESTARRGIPLLEQLRADETTSAFLTMADEFLGAQGYTEHGFRHANLVGSIAFNVLTHLGHDHRVAELGAVSGYLHDIGNVVSRSHHGQTSALLAYDLLRRLEVPPLDMAQVLAAVGNHEEQYGVSVSAVGAAVILADKADVHRSRVRKDASITMDIHDRVNFAVQASFLRVDPVARTITLELSIDTTISQVLEYFEIFLERMIMCRRAARTLGCDFKITVNDVVVL